MIENLIHFLIDETEIIETAQTSLQWLFDLLNTKLFVYGGTTITILSFVLMAIKFFVPRNKQLRVLETEKTQHLAEIESLKSQISEMNSEIDDLKNQVNVLIEANAYNCKVKALKKAKTSTLNTAPDTLKKVKVKVINNVKQ
jgi:peptidoglycan hydrolase CwlO-like protein